MVSGLYLSSPFRIASMCSGLSGAKSKGIPISATSTDRARKGLGRKNKSLEERFVKS